MRVAGIGLKGAALVVCLSVFSALADDAGGNAASIDIEDAPTPTTLSELLPPGGFEAVRCDRWLKTSYRDAFGQATSTRPTYTRRRIRVEDGQLVFTSQRLIVANQAYLLDHTLSYDDDGQLVGYTALSKNGPQTIYTIKTAFTDRLIKITRTYDPKSGHDRGPDTRTIKREDIAGTIPHHWLPLVYAYHIRKGHLGYRFTLHDITHELGPVEYVVADQGTEIVEHNDEEVRAHLLSLKTRTLKAPRPSEQSVRMLVMKDGHVLWSESVTGRSRIVNEPIDPEAFAEHLEAVEGED